MQVIHHLGMKRNILSFLEEIFAYAREPKMELGFCVNTQAVSLRIWEIKILKRPVVSF